VSLPAHEAIVHDLNQVFGLPLRRSRYPSSEQALTLARPGVRIMPAQIMAYETRAQREERLYRECEAAYEAHWAERSRSTHQALIEALRRWRAAQDDLRARRQPAPTAPVPDTVA
jgi:hypothetical protein